MGDYVYSCENDCLLFGILGTIPKCESGLVLGIHTYFDTFFEQLCIHHLLQTEVLIELFSVLKSMWFNFLKLIDVF